MTDSWILSQPRFEFLPARETEERADHYYEMVGLHLYIFNRVESTEQWRQRMLGPQEASSMGAPR
jgi:hypothetical protein